MAADGHHGMAEDGNFCFENYYATFSEFSGIHANDKSPLKVEFFTNNFFFTTTTSRFQYRLTYVPIFTPFTIPISPINYRAASVNQSIRQHQNNRKALISSTLPWEAGVGEGIGARPPGAPGGHGL